MPRVIQRKARKDYPAQGIKAGETYYYWKIKLARGGVECRSMTYPKPSQLNRGFAGLSGDLAESVDAAEDADALRSVAEEIRDLGSEQQEKFDNMPEGFQQGDTGQLLEERASQCEEWADAIEQACDEYDQKLEEIESLRKEWDEFDTASEPDNAPSDGSEVKEPDEERPDESAEDDALNELKDECGSACPF